MSIIASDTLTDSYLRRLDRGKYLALGILVVLVLAGVLGFVFHVAQNIPDLVSNIMYPLTSGVGAGWAFLTAYRAYRGPVRLGTQHARAWVLVGAGLLANCLGGLLYTILERSGQTILVPSFSDIGFTLFYPLIFIGLFLMPTALRFRLRLALDAVIATLCILGLSWFFFISKVFVNGVESKVSTAELIMSLSYPFWDVLLIFAIMLLIYRRTSTLFTPSLVLFGIGILLNVWADTGSAYTQTIGTYYSINFLIDPFWYLGFLLVGISGLFQYASICHQAYRDGLTSVRSAGEAHLEQAISGGEQGARWRFAQKILIYLPLAILLVLTFYSEDLEDIYTHSTTLFLTGLTALVGVLIAIRSLVATQENERLMAELALAKAEQEGVAREQAKLYVELSQAHERLQEMDKLKDQFMVTASHELRTPLTSIQGYLELLAAYGQSTPPEQRQEFLQKAQRGSEELVLLLNNVMDASRLEIDAGIRPAHLQPVQVLEAVQSVVDLLKPQAGKEHRDVEIAISPSCTVLADPPRLRQVLLNLGTNALKYSPEGTPITFSACSVNNPDRAIISVIDKGNGIRPEEKELLFQRFVRLERDLNSSIRGSGLGLYISRRLIEAMGGKIWVESSGIPGEGSSFCIQLRASH